MDKNEAYQTYVSCILEIEQQIAKEQECQNEIAQNERNSFSEDDSAYEQLSDQLEDAERTIRAQYRSVWESCTTEAKLRRPQEQRPEETMLTWEEAVQRQEQCALRIRNWFSVKKTQAIMERKRKLKAEEDRQNALAAAKAEEEKKKVEEERRRQQQLSERLIEEMKKRHR